MLNCVFVLLCVLYTYGSIDLSGCEGIFVPVQPERGHD